MMRMTLKPESSWLPTCWSRYATSKYRSQKQEEIPREANRAKINNEPQHERETLRQSTGSTTDTFFPDFLLLTLAGAGCQPPTPLTVYAFDKKCQNVVFHITNDSN